MVADEILVKKAQGGDTAAYGELVRRYQDRVYGLAVRMLNSPEDARDAAQEIFIKAYRALPDFNLRSEFATWLYRISSNTCLGMLRRYGRENQHRGAPVRENRSEVDLVADSRPGPEETYLENEMVGDLRRALQDLPVDYRVVLVLHHYQRLSYRQVAEVTGLGEKTVATRIHRAKKMLRERLLGGDGDALPERAKNVGRVSGRRMSAL